MPKPSTLKQPLRTTSSKAPASAKAKPAESAGTAEPRQPTPAPATQAPQAQPSANNQPAVKHPELKVLRCWGDKAITAAQAASTDLLMLETEDDYIARAAKEGGVTAEQARKAGTRLDRWTFQDVDVGKVICWNSTHNRFVDMDVVRGKVQDLLTRNWAGPTAIPGETVNGQPIIVGRDGQIIDGNKSLIAVWLAQREWRRNPERWDKLWPKEQYPDGPLLETLLVLGVSNHPRVVQTIDNTQSRSEADTFFTTGIAGKVLGKDDDALEPRKKQEVCRMLQTALDWVWARSGIGRGNPPRFAKTNRAAQEFLDRHPSISKAVKLIFDENQSRALSILRLSPGTCAAALFLMAQGKSNGPRWENAEQPAESLLDMSLWGKAVEFWQGLAKKQGQFNLLANALPKIMSADEQELAGSSVQKFCLIALDWRLWLAGTKLTSTGGVSPTARELILETFEDDGGQVHLLNPPDFGGIDDGPKVREPKQPSGGEPTPEQVQTAKAEIDKANGRAIKPVSDEEEKVLRRKEQADKLLAMQAAKPKPALATITRAVGEVPKPAPIKTIGGKPAPVKAKRKAI